MKNGKSFLIGFTGGLILWLVLTLAVGYVTRNGSLLDLTWLTEFGTKIWQIKFNLLTSNISQNAVDTAVRDFAWVEWVANLFTPLMYGVIGGIIYTILKKMRTKGEKVANG